MVCTRNKTQILIIFLYFHKVLLNLDGDILLVFDSMFPRSTHETFAQKVYQTFKDNKRFSKPKLARTDFTICHYAGDVSSKFMFFIRIIESIPTGEYKELYNIYFCLNILISGDLSN